MDRTDVLAYAYWTVSREDNIGRGHSVPLRVFPSFHEWSELNRADHPPAVRIQSNLQTWAEQWYAKTEWFVCVTLPIGKCWLFAARNLAKRKPTEKSKASRSVAPVCFCGVVVQVLHPEWFMWSGLS